MEIDPAASRRTSAQPSTRSGGPWGARAASRAFTAWSISGGVRALRSPSSRFKSTSRATGASSGDGHARRTLGAVGQPRDDVVEGLHTVAGGEVVELGGEDRAGKGGEEGVALVVDAVVQEHHGPSVLELRAVDAERAGAEETPGHRPLDRRGGRHATRRSRPRCRGSGGGSRRRATTTTSPPIIQNRPTSASSEKREPNMQLRVTPARVPRKARARRRSTGWRRRNRSRNAVRPQTKKIKKSRSVLGTPISAACRRKALWASWGSSG